ncbi:MAG: hypothetical protein COA78_10340 [Blastopirellula sp.]|nr:MAG: hypothetical protein COA78_10340 [Blastopirellula sp.]
MKTIELILSILIIAGASLNLHAEDKATPPPNLGKITGPEAEAFYLGVNAVIWGYPAVKFEDFMRERTSPEILKKGNPQAAVNQFGLVRDLRGPEYKIIATPNNDTLYAQAFCDVSREPLILSVPKVDGNRYYGMQLWDPNGDTFAYVGSRSTGREAGNYALVGPNWKGNLPKNINRIDCPYNGLVVWGRIGVAGPEDVENARAIQDQLRLTPLSKFENSSKRVPVDLEFSKQRVALDIPTGLPQELLFYHKLAESLKHTPPKTRDVVVAESLSQIGFKKNNTEFDFNSLNDAQKKGLAKAYQFALYTMDVNAQTTGITVNGWRWSPKSGIMGTDYLFRATFAKWFTGGNAPQEAIYMDGRKDDQGEYFSGTKKYVMHFKKGELPPAKAFWSLSMYNVSDGSFVENVIKRYAIGDRTPGLRFEEDGSLFLYMQHDSPYDPKKKANWLPTPKEGFYLDLRLYVPDDSLQKGTWSPPKVQVISS